MTEEQEKEYKRLEAHAKDCGVAFGIYSKQYADAIREMNDYWKLHKDESNPKEREKTFKEMIIEKSNKMIAKWKHRNY